MKILFRNFCFVIFLVLVTSIVKSQDFEKDSLLLINHISFLSSDSLQGREGGTNFEKHAANYIASQLKKNKIKPLFGKSYFQNFDFIYDSINFSSQNIAGYIDNKADSTIIIISHYDHIGHGGKLSKSFGSNEIHPGADDNASGVAANLLISKNLKKKNSKKYNYIFLFTGAHEKGLFGSTFFYNYFLVSNYKVKLIINLDMIGRLDANTKTMIFESNDNDITEDLLTKYSTNLIQFQRKQGLIGDHSKFSTTGINCLFLSSGIHSDYHKTSDKKEKINYTGILQIVNSVLNLIQHI